jgi:hypothetical protein
MGDKVTPTTIRIEFPVDSAAARSRLAESLESSLRSGGIRAERLKENSHTQDLGTIISILVSGPAIIALAHALQAWLVRNNQSTLIVRAPGKEIELLNVRSEDIPPALEYIFATANSTSLSSVSKDD